LPVFALVVVFCVFLLSVLSACAPKTEQAVPYQEPAFTPAPPQVTSPENAGQIPIPPAPEPPLDLSDDLNGSIDDMQYSV